MHVLRFAALAAVLLVASLAPAAAQGAWGALALSEKGVAYGYSLNYTSKEAAETRALDECGKHAQDCKIYATFQDTCVAVAGASNGAYGWAWGVDQAARVSRAMAQCRQQGGEDCSLAREFCTGSQPGQPGNTPSPPSEPGQPDQPSPKE